MPYQKMTKEEMKMVYQMILEEIMMEQGHSNDFMLYDFKKLGKGTLMRLKKKSGVKDKRKLKRIFQKFINSNGEIEKLKNSGKVSPYLQTEIKMCKMLGLINIKKRYKRSVFFKLNEENDWMLPKSNGYLQNYQKRHQKCGLTCKFENRDCSNSPISTSCETPLKEIYLSQQEYNIVGSNDSFLSLEFPISEYEQEISTSADDRISEYSSLDALENFFKFPILYQDESRTTSFSMSQKKNIK